MAWAPNYCSSAELKAYTRILDDLDDAQVALAIAAASRAVDNVTRRQFGVLSVAAARFYTARYDALRAGYVVDIDDLQTITDLVVATDTEGDETFSTTVTDYALLPRNAAADGKPWTVLAFGSDSDVATGVEQVRVTGLWGWTEVPDAIVQATLLQASRLLMRRNAPFGVAGSPETGSELRLLAKVDPDVEVALRPFKRRRWMFA